MTRATGRDRFASMPKEQQDALLGYARAEMLRRGVASWDDMVLVQQSRDWRAVITTAPVEVVAARAGVDASAFEAA